MKGIVFTEFLDMVEQRFSLEMVEKIIASSELASGGAYTSVGTYSAQEMVALVTSLATSSGTPVPELLQEFGRYLVSRFRVSFPAFFSAHKSAFGFLERVEDYIHVEVRKLYPDAELPRFEIQRPAAGVLVMVYRSPRCLADLAEGLIRGCLEHYGESAAIARDDLSGGRGEIVRFTLTQSGTGA